MMMRKLKIQIQDDGYKPQFSQPTMCFQPPMPLSFYIGEGELRHQLDKLCEMLAWEKLYGLPAALESWIADELGLPT